MRSSQIINKIAHAAYAAAIMTAVCASAARAQVSFVAPDQPADWTRYKTPHECLAAADREREIGWRAARRDTVPFQPDEHPPAVSIDAVKHCIARFSVATADRSDLKALFLLALLTGNDGMADSAAAQWVARSPTPRLRGQALEDIVDNLLHNPNARPVRVDRVREMIRQADAIGPAALREELHIHSGFAGYAEAVLDLDLMLSEARICDSLFQVTPTDPWTAEEREMLVFGRYIVRGRMAEVTFLRKSPDASFAQLKALGIPLDLVSRPSPPVAGVYSFKSKVPLPPPAGHISLVVFANQACGAQCAPNWATIRRLHRAFPDLSITIVAQTLGWYRMHAPPALAEEAELIRGYFQDDMQVPAAVVVDTTPHWFMPAPDGRRVNGTPPSFVSFGGAADVLTTNALIIDANGRIVFQNWVNPETERIFAAVMVKIGAVAAKSAGASAPSTVSPTAAAGEDAAGNSAGSASP